MNPQLLRDQVAGRVHAAMLTAMRADPLVLAQTAEAIRAPGDRALVSQARNLLLATTAALTTVVHIHRYAPDPHDRDMCRACGTPDCRTLRGIAEVLHAYGTPTAHVDRAEAWRRADAWFTHTSNGPVLVSVKEFAAGFIARGIAPNLTVPAGILIIDRHTGALTQWPDLPDERLTREYTHYLNRPL
ncbi:hypothetical protein [Actinomadura miaoliensis]|uniref:Uncharacterized protein n=1 Tax=Actinomadura miaoliensis TaxID=430685 RepID=A0ABP7W527_9ACTN